MNYSVLSRLTCEVHGPETLHHKGVCRRCHPAGESRASVPVVRKKATRQWGRMRSTELTPAESRVVQLLATGITHKEAAKILGIQRSAISNNVKRARERREGVRA